MQRRKKNRSVGVGRLATRAGYVRARSSGAGGLRPGQERVSSKLAGTKPPKLEDTQTTVDQLKERIAKTSCVPEDARHQGD